MKRTTAFFSAIIAGLVGTSGLAFGQWTSGGGITHTTDKVGVGTSAPTSSVHVTSTTIDVTPDVEGTQIAAGALQLSRFAGTDSPGYPYIDFHDRVTGQTYDARILYTSYGTLDRLQILGAELWVNQNTLLDQNLYVSGSVLIGGSQPPGGSHKLVVAGTGWITSGVWEGSDMRWKENIRPIDNALSKVMNLQGVTYNWRRSEFPEQNFPEGTEFGFIAQELEKVAPEAVRTGDDGYKGVSYEKLTALLAEAIKEQQKTIDGLKAEVAQLKSAVARDAGRSVKVAPEGGATRTPDIK